jgi:hypothetical protein
MQTLTLVIYALLVLACLILFYANNHTYSHVGNTLRPALKSEPVPASVSVTVPVTVSKKTIPVLNNRIVASVESRPNVRVAIAPAVDTSSIDKRLDRIRNQVFDAKNPYYHEERPPLFLYPAKPYLVQFVSVSSLLREVETFLEKSRKILRAKERSCQICVEHFAAAEILWNSYFRRLYPDTPGASPFVGVYVEMGALDGISGSNSLFFDEALHWDGLLIEPSPPNYAHCVTNRPHARKAEVAACACDAAQHPNHECSLTFVGNGGGVGGGIDSLAPREKKLHNPAPKVRSLHIDINFIPCFPCKMQRYI